MCSLHQPEMQVYCCGEPRTVCIDNMVECPECGTIYYGRVVTE